MLENKVKALENELETAKNRLQSLRAQAEERVRKLNKWSYTFSFSWKDEKIGIDIGISILRLLTVPMTHLLHLHFWWFPNSFVEKQSLVTYEGISTNLKKKSWVCFTEGDKIEMKSCQFSCIYPAS